MSYELVIGMEIKDDAAYARYREAMAPLLAEHGGGFRYDFKIAEVLRNEAGRAINRVFVIYLLHFLGFWYLVKQIISTFGTSEIFRIVKNKIFIILQI